MPALIFNGTLTANFQPSSPVLIAGEKIVLDFDLLIDSRTSVSVEWYPEYTRDNPLDTVNTRWFRETAEEDIGNGDVRMPFSIRRFSAQGSDAGLASGHYYLDTEFRRTHAIYRIQIRGLGCTARVLDPFGEIPSAPAP